mgnify:CR=1 FL=1
MPTSVRETPWGFPEAAVRWSKKPETQYGHVPMRNTFQKSRPAFEAMSDQGDEAVDGEMVDDQDVLRAMDPAELTNVQAMDAWEAVIGDMDSTASAFEERGWKTIVCHPGDVTVVESDARTGIDVLLPDNEFGDVAEFVETSTFDEYEVLRAEQEGVVYAVVVMQDTDAERVFLFPTYFEPSEFVEVAQESVMVYLRRLNGEYVELELEDPSLFLPDDV